MNARFGAAPSGGFIVRGRGLTWTRAAGLLAFALPGAGFIAGLFQVRGRPEFAFLEDAALWPAELRIIAVCGSLAALAGVADFVWHVRGLREVSKREERGEIVALALGGAPLFGLMAAAALSATPARFLTPVLVFAIFTVCCVCHDEFVYHRRACGRVEALFHRTLIFGNGVAFVAWFHWTFVRERLGA